MTSKELLSTSNNNIDIKPTGVSFDCTLNSRVCQTKEGVVAAPTQKTGRKTDFVRKTT